MTWATTWVLWLLPGAWLAVAGLEARRARRRRLLLAALGAPAPLRTDLLRGALVLVAVTAMVVGLAGPGGAPVPRDSVPGAGAPEVVLVMDVSGSMAVGDGAPDRMAVARAAALRVTTGMSGGRVGVVAYAGRPRLLLSPTEDRALVGLVVGELDPATMTARGSSLAAGVAAGVEAVGAGGALVLISDGEGFDGEETLQSAVSDARRAGVAVHTVTVGTAKGGPVPGGPPDAHSWARPELLARVAAETGGAALSGRDGTSLDALARRLGGAPTLPAGEPPGAGAVLALAALLALAVEGRVTDGRRRGR